MKGNQCNNYELWDNIVEALYFGYFPLKFVFGGYDCDLSLNWVLWVNDLETWCDTRSRMSRWLWLTPHTPWPSPHALASGWLHRLVSPHMAKQFYLRCRHPKWNKEIQKMKCLYDIVSDKTSTMHIHLFMFACRLRCDKQNGNYIISNPFRFNM